MPPLSYHQGHLAVQSEAQTTEVAERLADWIGPAAAFAECADLVVLASQVDGRLEFTVISGEPPVVRVANDSPFTLELADQTARNSLKPGSYGGLVISMATARRARINGQVQDGKLVATETFTLCRKYIAPSVPTSNAPLVGPSRREPIELRDSDIADILTRAETALVASISPSGLPDVSHRGGPPGFIDFTPDTAVVAWPEFVGDGVFKTAGNMRVNGEFTLMIPDFGDGSAIELSGRGNYTNSRSSRRSDALVRHREPYPIQGTTEGAVLSAFRLRGVFSPRERIEKAIRVTSKSNVEEQAPQ